MWGKYENHNESDLFQGAHNQTKLSSLYTRFQTYLERFKWHLPLASEKQPLE